MSQEFRREIIAKITGINDGWKAVASADNRRGKSESKGWLKKINAIEQLSWILEDDEVRGQLKGSLRVMDLSNGCGWLTHSGGDISREACETCLVDAPLISQVFSYESAKELLASEKFEEIVSTKSIRFGSQANILDLKMGPEMIEAAVVNLGRRGRKVKVWANYRSGYEERLDRLYEIWQYHRENLEVHLSLPYNRSAEMNRSFDKYVEERTERGQFKQGAWSQEEDGTNSYPLEMPLTKNNFWLADVRHNAPLSMTGRTIELNEINDKGRIVEIDDQMIMRKMGLGCLYLNPEGLWWKIYLTGSVSYTGQAFIFIDSKEKLEVVSRLPQHPDFYTPENTWKGGYGQLLTLPQMREIKGALKKYDRES